MKYHYDIIPLIKIPLRSRPVFTYGSNLKNLENSLVKISFGNKEVKGVVIKKTKKPFFPIKKISSLIKREFITNNQLSLAKKISDYYLTDLGSVLRFFVFKQTRKILPFKKSKLKKEKFPMLTREQSLAHKKIITSKEKKFLLFGPASSGKTEIIMRLIKVALKNKKQSLVVVPEIFLSCFEINRYQKRFAGESVSLLHSKMNPSEIATIWQNCKKGKTKIIISTKIGLFLPFKNLGLIAVDEEQDISHKQWDISPRYHSRKVASFLSNLWNAKLIYSSATPSMETIHQFSQKKKRKNLIKLPMLKKKKWQIQKPSIELIDLKKYFLKGLKGQIFFEESLSALRKTIKHKKLAFILMSGRGKNKITICDNCHEVLRCPKCKIPLIQISNNYVCLHCSYKKSLFSGCPNCQGFRLKNIGAGTEKAVENLKTMFSGARIRQADQTVFSKNKEREKLLKDILNDNIDILVGTQIIAKGFNFPNLELAVVTNAESWRGKTDYRYDERWLGNFFQLAGRINRPGSSQKGEIIIQTFQEKNLLFDFLKKWDWLAFAKKERKERKALGYPPYVNLIKLACKHSNLEKIEKYAKNIYEKAIKTGLIASEPYWGFNKNIRGIFEKNILIKISNRKQTKAARQLIEKLDNKWKIDVDPENIF